MEEEEGQPSRKRAAPNEPRVVEVRGPAKRRAHVRIKPRGDELQRELRILPSDKFDERRRKAYLTLARACEAMVPFVDARNLGAAYDAQGDVVRRHRPDGRLFLPQQTPDGGLAPVPILGVRLPGAADFTPSDKALQSGLVVQRGEEHFATVPFHTNCGHAACRRDEPEPRAFPRCEFTGLAFCSAACRHAEMKSEAFRRAAQPQEDPAGVAAMLEHSELEDVYAEMVSQAQHRPGTLRPVVDGVKVDSLSDLEKRVFGYDSRAVPATAAPAPAPDAAWKLLAERYDATYNESTRTVFFRVPFFLQPNFIAKVLRTIRDDPDAGRCLRTVSAGVYDVAGGDAAKARQYSEFLHDLAYAWIGSPKGTCIEVLLGYETEMFRVTVA